ncbi:MAG: BatD family protein, partial [Planctomycetota bacterium]
MSVDPRTVEVGEAVSLTVSLEGANPRSRPRISLPPGARIAGGPSQSHMTRIINGRRTSSIGYRYTLAFDKEGKFALGPATVATNRGTLRSGTVTVSVGKTRAILVFAELKPARCYVGQAVVATFAYARARRTDRDRLSVPFLKKIDGIRLSDPENLAQRWDESVRKTHRGLPGYDLVPLSMPSTKEVARTGRREIDGFPYEVWKVTRALLPQEPGRHEFGRAGATAQVVVGYKRVPYPMAVTRTVTASSEPLVLDVLALPKEGRPPGFESAVGSYELSASAHPRETKLGGDPILLTLTVSGEGNLETVARPKLVEGSGFPLGAAEMRHEMR